MQLTKAMKKFCEDQMWTSEDNIAKCKDVTIFKEQHFYPINWRQWPWMFKVKYSLKKILFAPWRDTLSKFGNCLKTENYCRRSTRQTQCQGSAKVSLFTFGEVRVKVGYYYYKTKYFRLRRSLISLLSACLMLSECS